MSWFNNKNLKNKWFWHHRDWPSLLTALEVLYYKYFCCTCSQNLNFVLMSYSQYLDLAISLLHYRVSRKTRNTFFYIISFLCIFGFHVICEQECMVRRMCHSKSLLECDYELYLQILLANQQTFPLEAKRLTAVSSTFKWKPWTFLYLSVLAAFQLSSLEKMSKYSHKKWAIYDKKVNE